MSARATSRPRPQRNSCCPAVIAAAAFVVFASSAGIAAPPSPGGHIPVYFGGHNYSAYATTGVAGRDPVPILVPLRLNLLQNPSRGSARIQFRIAPGQPARVALFNTAGSQVREWALAPGTGGDHEVSWDGRDSQGRRVSSGLYLVRIEAGAATVHGRLVYLR